MQSCKNALRRNPRTDTQMRLSCIEIWTDSSAVSQFPHGRLVSLNCCGRWARRNRGLAVTGTVAATATLVAMVASISGWVLTSNALDRESTARIAEGVAKSKAQTSLAIAQQRYLENKATVNTFFNEVCDNPRFKRLPQSETLRSELLDLALGYFREFAQKNVDDIQLTYEVAQTNVQIGEILLELGRPSDAILVFNDANDLVRTAYGTGDDDRVSRVQSRCLTNLAKTEMELGMIDSGIKHIVEAVEIHRELLSLNSDDAEATLKTG